MHLAEHQTRAKEAPHERMSDSCNDTVLLAPGNGHQTRFGHKVVEISDRGFAELTESMSTSLLLSDREMRSVFECSCENEVVLLALHIAAQWSNESVPGRRCIQRYCDNPSLFQYEFTVYLHEAY